MLINFRLTVGCVTFFFQPETMLRVPCVLNCKMFINHFSNPLFVVLIAAKKKREEFKVNSKELAFITIINLKFNLKEKASKALFHL